MLAQLPTSKFQGAAMIYSSIYTIRCNTETDEVGADEPYVIVSAVDLASLTPTCRTFRYGVFEDVDYHENRYPGFQPFWGLTGQEAALPSPDTAIFIAAVMENDNGDAEALRGVVNAATITTIVGALTLSRADKVKALLKDIGSALRIPTGWPNFDDRVGGPQELQFSKEEVALAETGQPARKNLIFRGDGGRYTVTFEARNRGQTQWRWCAKCRTMFFDGTTSKGRCPAGGGHQASGYMFYLPHDHAGPLGGQGDWRFCDKCFAMFWSGDRANQGRCPGGDQANPGHRKSGYQFFLPHSHNGPGQDQWRFCEKCRVMFWNGAADKGRCHTGGGHRAQGLNFRLDFELV
jgi:hypothetical protein